MSYFDITLAVSGAVTLKETKIYSVQKGDVNPFRTDLRFRKAANGLHIEITARGDSPEEAREAAVYFVGQHLDILSLRTGESLHLNPRDYGFKEIASNVRRIIEPDLIDHAIDVLPRWRTSRKAFLRSLSWYRKAKNSEDPVDCFMAYWSALEGVCAKCARPTERTKRGIINQIADCFDQTWGSIESWKIIPNDAIWINEFQQIRNGIAHGFISVDIDQIKAIGKSLRTLEKLTGSFLLDWEINGTNPEPQETTTNNVTSNDI